MHDKLRARAHAGWAIHQTVTALAAIGVIVAMVAVAQRARQDEKRHQTVQVLVEHVRASGLELENYVWRELAEGFASGERQLHPGPVVAHALRLWAQLNSAVTVLRARDHSAPTEALLNDAGRLYGAGMSLVSSAHGLADVRQGMTATEALFAPIVDVLDSDAVTAAAAQRRVAGQAADRAGVAYFGSLAGGLLLLVLLGFELHRTRRGASLTKQQRTLEQRSERRIRALVEHSSDIIVVIGPDLNVRWQSTSVETGLGHSPNDVTGRRVSSLAHPDDVQLLESHLAAAMRQSGPVRVTARFGHAKDGWRDLEVIADNRLTDPEVEGVVLSMRDVSDRKALEDELRHQAFHDSLTGLANRALFEDRLAHCLAGARRHGRPAAILFLDLDDFKTINDSLGHASGDELLQAVARRIAGVVRATDTAARLGGDEFAVLVESLDTLRDAEATAERLLDALMPPFHIAERELRITASIGIAVSDGSTGAENLLRNADTAMYAAKESGKGTAQKFEDGMHRARARPARADRRASTRARALRVRVGLPADRRPPAQRGRRVRGARSLGAPGPRPAPPG